MRGFQLNARLIRFVKNRTQIHSARGIFPFAVSRKFRFPGFSRRWILAKNGVRKESKHRFSKILTFGIFPASIFYNFWLPGRFFYLKIF